MGLHQLGRSGLGLAEAPEIPPRERMILESLSLTWLRTLTKRKTWQWRHSFTSKEIG